MGTAEKNSKDGLWTVYTAHSHTYTHLYGFEEKRKALGIISGGATSDLGQYVRISARKVAC